MYRGINLEFEIVGVFPPGRWDGTAVMNAEYLNEAIDAYGEKARQSRPPHGQQAAEPGVAADAECGARSIASRGRSPPRRNSPNPAVKCETLSSLVTTAFEALRDIIWGVRWLLAPAALATLSLVIANSISISVRERRMELAVLKVLGFRPRQILFLVLGEALLLGTVSGLASATLTYVVINDVIQRNQVSPGLLRFVLHSRQRVLVGHGDGRGDRLAGQRRSRLDRSKRQSGRSLLQGGVTRVHA